MNPTRTIMSMLARVSPIQMLIIIAALAAVTTCYIGHEIDGLKPPIAQAPAPVSAPKTRVLFCARNIAEGDTISYDDLEVRQVEASRSPLDALTDPTDAVGRPAKFGLVAGSPLAARDLAPAEGSVGFQAKLHPGERAVTLGVDSNTGVAGFIMPDSHVDVMVQVGNGADTKTRAILSDVRVMAAGTTYKKRAGEEKPELTSNVTLAVRPEEASKLINGMSAGRIYLTLRSDRDHTPIAVTDVNSLFLKPKSVPSMVADSNLPLLPPPIVANAVMPTDKRVEQPEQVPPVPFHEIEQWQGDKRDVTQVHQL